VRFSKSLWARSWRPQGWQRPRPTRPHGESAPIVIGQLQASTPQLAAKSTILFEQITKDFSLLRSSQPVRSESSNWSAEASVHGRSLYHGPQIVRPSAVDPVMGHYGLHALHLWMIWQKVRTLPS
jgi:hypothetical protein